MAPAAAGESNKPYMVPLMVDPAFRKFAGIDTVRPVTMVSVASLVTDTGVVNILETKGAWSPVRVLTLALYRSPVLVVVARKHAPVLLLVTFTESPVPAFTISSTLTLLAALVRDL